MNRRKKRYIDDGTVSTRDSQALSAVNVFTLFILFWQSTFYIANIAVSILLRFFSLFPPLFIKYYATG